MKIKKWRAVQNTMHMQSIFFKSNFKLIEDDGIHEYYLLDNSNSVFRDMNYRLHKETREWEVEVNNYE